jgi:hypothetical protein
MGGMAAKPAFVANQTPFAISQIAQMAAAAGRAGSTTDGIDAPLRSGLFHPLEIRPQCHHILVFWYSWVAYQNHVEWLQCERRMLVRTHCCLKDYIWPLATQHSNKGICATKMCLVNHATNTQSLTITDNSYKRRRCRWWRRNKNPLIRRNLIGGGMLDNPRTVSRICRASGKSYHAPTKENRNE